MRNHIVELLIKFARLFILGGKSSFTAVSEATGNKFSYRVHRTTKEGETFYNVWVFDGNMYVWIGVMVPKYNYLFENMLETNDPSMLIRIKAFDWMWNNFFNKDLAPPQVKLFYSGVCPHCNRKLKTKKSLERGLGYHCQKKIIL